MAERQLNTRSLSGEYTVVYTPTGIRCEHYSLHWNGSTWSVVAMPPVPGTDGQLVYQFNAIDAISPTNVWAVGYAAPSGSTGAQTLTMNWNGTAWSTVSSPDVGSSSLLAGVSSTPGGPIWAAGYSGTPGAFNPLMIQHS